MKRKVPSSKNQKDIEKMMDRIKSDKQLANEVRKTLLALYRGYAQRVENPVDISDAIHRGSEKLLEDGVAELVKMGYDPIQADSIAMAGKYGHPEDILDHYDKKTLADYNSVLRTLATRNHIRLP